MFNFIKNLINFEKMSSFFKFNFSNNFKNSGFIKDSIINTGDNVQIEVNKDRHITVENKKYLLDFFGGNKTIHNVVIQYEYGAETKKFAEEVGFFIKENKISISGLDDMRSCTGFGRDIFSIELHPFDSSYAILRIGPHN